jgi:hypothetical protein
MGLPQRGHGSPSPGMMMLFLRFKSGPAVKPGEQSNVKPDQSKVPGLPGNKSGPAAQKPKNQQSE